jgi:uncharacterized protein with HEPN domain
VIDPQTELLLDDMLAYARTALEFTKDKTATQFAADLMLVLATTRAVEIVGEAAYQVAPDIQATLPTLPWRDAIAMRHRLVHGYRRLDARIIFATVRDRFPALIAELERILNKGARS